MRRLIVLALAGCLVVTACSTDGGGGGAAAPAGQEDPWAGFPAVEGPEPSREVIAFYYAWYGTPDADGAWNHWDGSGSNPPDTIASDFYPTLGAYSSSDRAVVAQHMAWLREAGVGVIALSYWRGETPDAVVDTVFRSAEHYGIQVAFLIEPYAGRSAEGMASVVHGLLERYGDSPALYRLEAESLYLPGVRPRPLVFVWATNVAAQDAEGEVPTSYWAPGVDAIHETDDAFVVACPCGGRYAESVFEGHFDGAYNYASVFLEQEDFSWARSMPPGSLYIPSVMPGSLQNAIGAPSLFVDRDGGAAYRAQWEAALSQPVRPALVSITSFNEWHEGSQIEPAVTGHVSSDPTREWFDYGTVGEDGYLVLTRQLIAEYLARDRSGIEGEPVRVVVRSSSDWTRVELLTGVPSRPEVLRRSPGTDVATADTLEGVFGLFLTQALARAEGGQSVEAVFQFRLSEVPASGLDVRIQRGGIGATTATFQVRRDGAWVDVASFTWSGFGPGVDNIATYAVPRERLV